MTGLDHLGFLGFDTFGTVVDWRSGVARSAAPFLDRHGIGLDPFAFAEEWRSLYQPAMDKHLSGRRSYPPLRGAYYGELVLPHEREHALWPVPEIKFHRGSIPTFL
ncbi:hypothetical protein [Methylobacterium sp.]|uniref:hypothetical protein n=1 Tax=Methylobacterium sp. TaxID=409 RepID=UPI003B021A91